MHISRRNVIHIVLNVFAYLCKLMKSVTQLFRRRNAFFIVKFKPVTENQCYSNFRIYFFVSSGKGGEDFKKKSIEEFLRLLKKRSLKTVE